MSKQPASRSTLFDLTGAAALRHMRAGTLTAEVYTATLLSRYERVARANALTWFDGEKALQQARNIDRSRAMGQPVGSLAGLPIVVKDNIDTVGFPTSAGTRILQDNFPQEDAPVVRALLDQGAILLAKTNMHEVAGGGTSNNPVFGPARNPYDARRVAGGSSGGTASAIALRFASAGLGTDTAGSVRIPAASCGIAGLRPSTQGRQAYSQEGLVPLALNLDTIGPMGRCVEDVALLHAVIAAEPQTAAIPLTGVKLGLPKQLYWEGLDAATEAIAREALRKLEYAGVQFVEVDISSYIEETQQVFEALLTSGVQGDLDRYFHDNGKPYTRAGVVAQIASRDTRHMFESATDFSPALGMEKIHGARARLIQKYHETLLSAGVPALCFPTLPLPAPQIRAGGDAPDDTIDLAGTQVSEILILIRNTSPACALGAPALSFPAGLTQDGLPVGLELEGLAGHDSRVLGLGLSCERVLGRLPSPE